MDRGIGAFGPRSEAILTDQWTAPPPPSDERADVLSASKGDHQAFERLYRLNVARILGLARRLAGPHMAEELTQDVFVRAWEKLAGFRGEARFGTWLYRLAVNVIIEHHRGFARRSLVERDDEQAFERAAAGPPDTAFTLDLESALELVPPGARQVFVLHDVEGYKHGEIATLMKITTGTSKGQLHRARMALRKHLGGRCGQRPPAGT
jgi:RNA polymerase sigma-70 factor, ECF subfamily